MTAPLEGYRTPKGSVVLALLFGVLALATLPFARIQLAPIAPFMPIFGTLIVVFDLSTALALILQARIGRHGPTAVLAGAYVYSALTVVPHLLTFPGVFAPDGLLGATSQSAVWLWAFWHGGFALWVLAYVVVDLRFRPADATPHATSWWLAASLTIALATVAAATVVATRFSGALPVLVRHGSFHPGTHQGPLTAVAALAIAAMVAVLGANRQRTVTQPWLGVALVALSCDVTLSLFAGSRFSVGWYLGRVYSVISAGAVLAAFLAQIGQAYQRIFALATVDGLTGLANRRAFDDRLQIAYRDARRRGRPVSVIILDVDEFKRYNDTYGHVAGDNALRIVSATIEEAISRAADTVARYGGEEFAVILPETTLLGARVVADRIRAAIEHRRIPHARASTGGFLTVSAGCATWNPAMSDAQLDLVDLADGALYQAKAKGRNRVELDRLDAGGVAS